MSTWEWESLYFARGTLFPNLALQKSGVLPKTYTAQALVVFGQREVSVKNGHLIKVISITVVNGDGPNLWGRN